MLRRLTLPILYALAMAPSYALAQPTSEPVPPPPPAVANLLPAEVGGVFLMNTSGEAWTPLARFIPIPEAFLATGVGFLPYFPSEINYATDVRPWLEGWSAIALMPAAEGGAASGSVQALMVAPVKDPSKIDALVEKVKASRGKPGTQREYQGVTILEWAAEEIPVEEIPPSEPSPEPLPPSQLKELTRLNPALTSWMPQLKAAKSLPLPFLAQAQPELSPVPPPVEESLPEGGPTLEPEPPMLPPLIKPGLAFAVLPSYVVASSTAAPIEQLIDAKGKGKKLAQDPNFLRSVQSPDFGRSLYVGYGNIAQLAKIAANFEFPTSSVPLPFPTPDPAALKGSLETLAQAYSAVDFKFWVQDEGIRSQSRIYYKTPQPGNVSSSEPKQIPSRLPSATYISLSSANFNKQWQALSLGWTQQPQTARWLDKIRQKTLDLFGLDLDKDIISWMDGEYAAFMFPTNGGVLPAFDPRLKLGLGAIVQTSDRAAAEQFLQKFDLWAKTTSNGNVAIATSSINAQPVTTWEIDAPEFGGKRSVLAHGWLDNDTLLVTTGIEPMRELNPKPYQNLAQSFTFQTATQTLPSPNDGYGYVNMGSLLAFIYNFLPPELNNSPQAQLAKQVVGSIRSLSVTSSSTPEQEQSDFLVVLSPLRQP